MPRGMHVQRLQYMSPALTPTRRPCALQRIEEQRLTALLQEQRDAPVDVQVSAGWRSAEPQCGMQLWA